MSIRAVENFLQKIDRFRDRLLFIFIKRFWPRFITPNHLSVLKIISGILVGVFLFLGIEEKNWIIFLFFLTIALDLFDGSVARALNKKTRLGAFIDPIGDKTLIIPVAIFTLSRLYYSGLLFALIFLESISIAGSLYYYSKKEPIESNIFGKVKMALQSGIFAFILLNWPSPPSTLLIYILWVTILLTIMSICFKLFGFQKEN